MSVFISHDSNSYFELMKSRKPLATVILAGNKSLLNSNALTEAFWVWDKVVIHAFEFVILEVHPTFGLEAMRIWVYAWIHILEYWSHGNTGLGRVSTYRATKQGCEGIGRQIVRKIRNIYPYRNFPVTITKIFITRNALMSCNFAGP